MLHDRLWVGAVGSGTERHTRLADNPLVVADQLDALAGVKRERLAGNVQWLDPAADRRLAIALGSSRCCLRQLRRSPAPSVAAGEPFVSPPTYPQVCPPGTGAERTREQTTKVQEIPSRWHEIPIYGMKTPSNRMVSLLSTAL